MSRPPPSPPSPQRRERADSLKGSWRAVGIGFLLGMVLCAPVVFYINSDVGKANRLAGMREACAAGRAEPQNCIKEGVPMTWAIQGETK